MTMCLSLAMRANSHTIEKQIHNIKMAYAAHLRKITVKNEIVFPFIISENTENL